MFQNDLLAGKRILITGGGSGLGLSMGLRFRELGATLVICGRRGAVLEEAAAELGGAETHVCDVRDPQAIDAMLDAIWATAPLDGLVNNAAGNFIARSETLSHRALDAVLNIVLHGTAYVTLGCGRRWLDSGHKATVLSIIASYAWTGSAYVVPSAMGKAGVLAMTQSLAVEWGGRGVRLNAIAPGPFPTPGAWERLAPKPEIAEVFETRNPLGRTGEHIELANLASFLMSDFSGYINGEAVVIDGGGWLQGAGQFSFVGDMMSEDDWAALRPAKKG